MKTLLLIAAIAFVPLAALAQNQNVTQVIATKRVNSDIVIPSGKSFTVDNGGSITISSGATTSGILSNASLAGLSTGIATITTGTGAFGTFSTSPGLAALISDETGSGALVFGTSPTFVTPTLGVATATSINKLIFTEPATSATLAIADGKTFTASNTLTFTGTDSTSFAFPSTSGTVATLAATQTLSGKTLTAPVLDQGLFTEAAAPATPASGRVAIYAKTDGLLYSKDDAGVETLVSGGAGGGGGMTNPMTTSQDIIVGGSSGTPGRLGVGSDGQVLKVVSGSVAWGADSTGSGSLPGTPTAGDITYYDGADWASLGIGTAGQVLKTNAGATAPEWGAASGGAALFVGRSAKTGAYTVVAGDKGYLIDCTSGSFTVSFDPAAMLGDGFFAGVVNSGSGTITLNPDGTEVIREGSSASQTIVLRQGEGMVLVCNGANWLAAATTRFWTNNSSGSITAPYRVTISDTTASSGTTSGALVVGGGVGVGDGVWIGGPSGFNNATAATSTASASVIFAGGVGIAGALYTRVPVDARTSALSVVANRTNAVFTNEGATAQVVFTLPTAAANLIYSFVVQDADGLRVTAASGDTIRIAGTATAAAGYVENATIGSTLTLVAINATEWIATSVNGTWTFGP